MTNIISPPSQLKLLLDSIDYPHLMDIINHPWYIEGNEVHWNSENNLLDLYNQEGQTFGGWLPEGKGVWEGYTVVNYDTQCGQWVTLLLNNEKQVTIEELESLV